MLIINRGRDAVLLTHTINTIHLLSVKLELNLRKIEMDMDRRVNIEKLNISLSIIGTCPMPNECKDKKNTQKIVKDLRIDRMYERLCRQNKLD